MAKSVCFYFQVHQPNRLDSEFNFFKIGSGNGYFDESQNKEIMEKVAENCYLPANDLLRSLIERFNGRFKVSFSFSGVVLEQMEKYAPRALQSFKDLVKTGAVEILSETYYHSLASVYSEKEFVREVKMHDELIEKLFGVKPCIFRNTELIYSDNIAKVAQNLGFHGILAEGTNEIIQSCCPNYLYHSKIKENEALLLKNYSLSDDIAFRFDRRRDLVSSLKNAEGDFVNLFMDYETIGEHNWRDSGIFEYLQQLVSEFLSDEENYFLTPSEIIEKFDDHGAIAVPEYTSWADEDRNLSAWAGNEMQKASLEMIYELEDEVLSTNDPDKIKLWSNLLTSDHFYYMSTKFEGDGAVHSYFSPFASPHEAFIVYTNVVNDFRMNL